MLNHKHPPAYIAFSSLTIIAAAALAIAISVSILGVTQNQTSFTFKKGQQTLYFADGCLQEALIRLRGSASYTSGSYSQGDLSCTISVTNPSPTNYTINVAATHNQTPTQTKRIQAQVKKAGSTIRLLSWQQI